MKSNSGSNLTMTNLNLTLICQGYRLGARGDREMKEGEVEKEDFTHHSYFQKVEQINSHHRPFTRRAEQNK